MYTVDERIAQLEKQVSELTAFKKRNDYEWSKVLFEARNYARMKTFGQYVEKRDNGDCLISVGKSDQ